MLFRILTCLMFCVPLLVFGCDSKVTDQEVTEQENRIAELEKQLQAAKEDKQKAIENASQEAQKEAEERIAELAAELQEERGKLSALEERQQVEDEMEKNLEDMAAKIDSLEEQAENATGDREIELNKRIAELETKHDQLQEKLEELRAASGDAWATVKQETEQLWNEASTEAEDAIESFSEDEATDEKSAP